MNDPHIGYVIAAYAVAAATILGMILAVVGDYFALSRRLGQASEALEAARGGRMTERR